MFNIDVKEIEQRIGNGVHVEIIEVPKNNGIIKHGVVIKEDDSQAAPTIYVDDMSEEDMIDNVIRIYENSKIETNKVNEEVKAFLNDKDAVLSRVVPAIINHDMNERLLESVMHEPVLDLEIIYRVRVTVGSATITNKMAEYLNISIKELHDAALNNIKDSLKIKNFTEFMPVTEESTKAMWLISNEDMFYGASMLIDPQIILSAMAEATGVESDVYIIPSSVHELIAIQAKELEDICDLKFIKDLICFVNTNELEEQDFLSNNLYVLKNGTNGIGIVEEER